MEKKPQEKSNKGEENDLVSFLFSPVHTSQKNNNEYFNLFLIHIVLIKLKHAELNVSCTTHCTWVLRIYPLYFQASYKIYFCFLL